MQKKRIRDYGVIIGRMRPGARNAITDVPGVKVGHVTIRDDTHRTGVTVVVPGPDNAFVNKYTAACYVHNGFGKSAGLVQIGELGTLETPIALTNTLNVGLVWDGIVQYTVDRCRAEGVNVTSLNPVVGECNDSGLSDIAARAVTQADVLAAIAGAGEEFEEGDVGAGTGTVCYGLKGGIGSASRVIEIGGREYTVGVLVQSNFGSTVDLTVGGAPVGERILRMKESRRDMAVSRQDQGSIMTVLATDLPVSDRQLYRIIRRTGVGIARTGAYTGHGSGEVMIGFTTANRVPKDVGNAGRGSAGPGSTASDATGISATGTGSTLADVKAAGIGEPAAAGLLTQTVIHEDLINKAFQAAAEASNEAILNSMVCAGRAVGRDGKVYYSLAEFLPGCLEDQA